jgi:PAS domain S-box-containing protein
MESERRRLPSDAAHRYPAMPDRTARDRDGEYSSVLNGILDASTEYSIVATQLDGTFLLWNEGARRIYGYEAAEVMGKNLRMLHLPEDVTSGKVDEILATALDHGRWEGLATRVRKGGEPLQTRIVLTVRRDRASRPIGYLSISKDISDEVRLADRLQDSEAYNRGLIESAIDGMLATTLDGRIIHVNKEVEELTGRPRDELIGTRWRDLVAPPSAADEATQQALEVGRVKDIELKIRRPAGELVDVSYNATLFQGEGRDHLKRIIATVRDVAESKRLLEQLEMRNRELEIQNERVQQANRMKSEFLASMSHELRTPLNSIIGFSDFLLTAEDGRLDPDQREQLTHILNSGNHLLSLISDILDLAKVESGKLELKPVPFVLADAVDEACSSLRPQLIEHGLELRTDLAPEIDRVVLDRLRFKQVLYNLLSNAVKFTPNGGRIDVTVTPNGESRFLLSVRDSGIGIPAKDLARIFREFEQLDAGTTRKYSGTGLGLPVTQKLVDLMGGTIRVQSEVGVGSTFTVWLPRVRANLPSHGAVEEGARV